MSDLQIHPYVCPLCVGGLTTSWDGRETIACLHCSGTGLTDDPCGEARRAPRPPGVMRTACADCALRRGSPELEDSGARLPEDGPFWCHQGLPVSATGRYEPVAMCKGQPLGAMVCAGWWALKTGEPLPAAEYREIPITEDDVTRRWGKTDATPSPDYAARYRKAFAVALALSAHAMTVDTGWEQLSPEQAEEQLRVVEKLQGPPSP